MEFIKDTTWDEVFEGWREREATRPEWIECATKTKGWDNWEGWRMWTALQFKGPEREWKLYEFTDPMIEIPKLLVGPYPGWQYRHPQKNNFTFAEMVDDPVNYRELTAHGKISSIKQDFPSPTGFIGFIRADVNRVLTLEGHHRSTTVALAARDNEVIDFPIRPQIALAHLPIDELGILDEMIRRGSARIQE